MDPVDFSFDVRDRELSPKEETLLEYLEREYTAEIVRDVLVPLLTQTSPVSLRALDWAVVNWSKQHNVVCSSIYPGKTTNVYVAYRETLGFWKRRLFDPFRRRHRISVVVDGESYETTLGQANFALFTYQTGILAYVVGHLDAIEDDMNTVSKRQKRLRTEAARRGVRKKRRELTPAAGTVCVAYDAPFVVTFD